MPGDPAVTLAGGIEATPERIVEVREELHLDEPLIAQYGRWLSDAARLDFGESLFTNQSVSDELVSRVPITVSLALAALLVGLVLGVPVGVLSGVFPGGWIDRALRAVTSLAWAIPAFWLATILVMTFAVQRTWLPPSGFVRINESPTEWLRYIALPAITLGVNLAAAVARQLRGSLLDVMQSNYVRAAWARGASLRTVVAGHALKNAAQPAVTVIGLQMGYLLGGSVLIELIFSIPGIGNLMVNSVIRGDVPVIQGVTVAFVLMQLLASLLVDITYRLINPRVRIA